MNRVAVFAIASSLALFACTSTDDKPAKSPSAAVDSIQNPTGTFDANNAGSAFSKYDSGKSASSGLAGTGGGGSAAGGTSGSSSTQSLHVLAGKVQTSSSSCSEGSSCACDGGGTFSYQRQTTDYGPALTASFDQCVFDDGDGFSGDLLVLVSDKPLLQGDKASIGTDAAADKSLLLAADGMFSSPSKSVRAEVVFLAERGVDYLAVDVDDGRIVIGVRASDGLAVVYAKDTTWTCTAVAGAAGAAYTCVDQTSGKKVDATKS